MFIAPLKNAGVCKRECLPHTWTGESAQYRIRFVRALVGQSFGFASELPFGPEVAVLPMNHREFPRKTGLARKPARAG
jgi:hypothetical protein